MHKLVKSFLYFIYVIIVGGLLAAIILTFHQGQSNSPVKISTSKPSQTATAQTSTSKQSSDKSTSTKKTSSATSSSKSTPASTSSAAATNSSPASSTTPVLTNTGPGDTIGLFAGVSLIAGMLHRRRLVRQSID